MSSPKHVLYYSPRCMHCNKLIGILSNVQELDQHFEKVNIDTLSSLPNHIRSVPTILINKQKIAYGRQAFEFVEEEKKLYLDPFEHGFGGGYSYIESDGLCEKPSNFTFLTNEGFQTERISSDQSQYQTREEESKGKSELEQLIEKRNSEVPQPLMRK